MTQITKELQSMPFSDMIGTPLMACVEAQEKAAMTTVRFIRKVGFKTKPETKTVGGKRVTVYVPTDEVIPVIFKYTRDEEDVQLTVPLLTIVPIPYIAINNVSIDFKANLKSVVQTTYDDTYAANAGWDYGYKADTVTYNAGVSTKRDSKATQQSQYSVEATIDVSVQAGQDSMPAGLAKVLEMLNQSIMVTPIEKKS